MSDEYQPTFDARAGNMFADPQQAGTAPSSMPDWMQSVAAAPPSLQDSPTTNPQTMLSDPDYMAHYTELEHAGEKLMGEQRANTGRMVSEMERDSRDMQNVPVPQLGQAPKAPERNFGKGVGEYLQIATALAALAGGLSRNNSTIALTAFAGAVKGFTQGKEQEFQDRIEEWKAASDQVKTDNQAKLDQYDLIWKNKKANMDQKMAAFKLVAAQYSDEITYNLAERKDYTTLAMANAREKQMQAQMAALQEKLKQGADKIKMALDDRNRQLQTDMSNEADRFIDGVPNAGSGFARSPQMRAKWLETVDQRMKDRGLTNADIERNKQEYVGKQREQSAIGQRAGQLAIISNEAANIIPAVQNASRASPRRGLAAWNAVTNQWKVQKGDPAFATLVTQTNSLISLYGAVLARGGQGTVEQREHARQMLNPNQPPEAFEASLRAIAFDVNVARQAPQNVREENRTGNVKPIELQPPASSQEWGDLKVQ